MANQDKSFSVVQDKYIPGVCNIGPEEIAKRKRAGWIGAGVSALLLLLFVLFAIPPIYRLIIFLPVTSAASGFLQAYFHFCAGFGFKGVYNVIKPAGQTETVQQKEFRKKDRQKALQITGFSVFIGLVFATVAYYLPL